MHKGQGLFLQIEADALTEDWRNAQLLLALIQAGIFYPWKD